MGIFDRLRKKTPAADSSDAPVQIEEKDTKEVAKAPAVPAAPAIATASLGLPDVLLAPRVSEKAALLASRGTYIFNVPVSANKGDVTKAVEKLYKVNVASVRIQRGAGKTVRRGRQIGTRARWKKALVSLKAGQKLEINEGV